MKSLIISLSLIFACGVLNDPSENSTEPECTETVDCAGVCGGSSVEDCTGECGGSAVVDACGVCGGNTNSADECPDASCVSEVCISIIYVNNNSLDIGMINSVSVAGFQFDISGISNLSSSGGLAEAHGLSVSSSIYRILGFSFSGSAIPSNSNGILIHITGDITDEICIDNPIFSDTDGNSLSYGTINCITIDI